VTFSASAAPVIQLRGVHKYYGDYHALRGIDLEIKQGEFFSLLGPSGCGKTTLLRTIAGFESPSSGVLMIGGKDMAGVAANLRPTNMVFQSYAIFPHLTVAQNVGFGLRRDPRPREEKAKAVQDALTMVGLDGYGNRAAPCALGRPAAARGLGPGADPQAQGAPPRRAAVGARQEDARIMQLELIRLQRNVGITSSW
jgi:spermidine/putrescine transport system ATP-binding protein